MSCDPEAPTAGSWLRVSICLLHFSHLCHSFFLLLQVRSLHQGCAPSSCMAAGAKRDCESPTNTIKQGFPMRDDLVSEGISGSVWKDFGCHTESQLLASSGWGPGVLLNTLQCTGQPSPTTKIMRSNMSKAPRWRSPGLACCSPVLGPCIFHPTIKDNLPQKFKKSPVSWARWQCSSSRAGVTRNGKQPCLSVSGKHGSKATHQLPGAQAERRLVLLT